MTPVLLLALVASADATAGQAAELAVAASVEAAPVTLDLSSDWSPRFLREDASLGDVGAVPFHATYVGLADGRFDVEGAGPRAAADRFLELWGVSPSRRVVLERLQDRERHACHDAVDDADDGSPLLAIDLPLLADTTGGAGRRDAEITRLRARRAAGRAIDDARLQRLEATRAGILALQGHLVCDGFLEPHHVDGGFGPATADALALLQRREAIPVRDGVLDVDTRDRLLLSALERDWLALVRVIRERVVDSLGLIEDGSAAGAPGLVLGHALDPTTVRAPLRETPALNPAGDVIAAMTEAAVVALGLQDPATAARVLLALPDGPVEVALPPPPPWHGPEMALVATIDRGDVDDRGLLRPGATRRPMLTLTTTHQGVEITLARLPTTVGGMQREKLPDGSVTVKRKASPTGRFVWRRLWAQPSWYAPPTTPDDELILRGPRGAVVNDEGIGPGYRSAYGLVMLQHHRMTTWKGTTDFGETGIRTHGTGNVRSIFRGGPSHGCHRLLPLHVGRLASFLLAHRAHRREGPIRDIWERDLHSGGATLHVVRTVRGVRFEFEPPIDVVVLAAP